MARKNTLQLGTAHTRKNNISVVFMLLQPNINRKKFIFVSWADDIEWVISIFNLYIFNYFQTLLSQVEH